ncbi:Histidinol-phosphate aminotransferase [Candidatus Portiera aleyrodidarum]|uniref:histidinol-phosphate transaminase n=1 Tax=Candidatus Portiera aleyrodidarum TaxID=91844 RepID=UPI0005D9325F|nr:histidinol-phosphate transaminase [Candidatus Portiera aleyrodidarum]CEL12535.1 Histidinol-phosphate aminotransferase [Candidatus Portiera aleyrodidarum]
MIKFLSYKLKKLNPYIPGEQPYKKMIKLNTNENPYPPTQKIKNLLKNFNSYNLRLYPDPTTSNLRKNIAKRYKIKYEQIFVGNGSDEVLALAFLAFFCQKLPLIIPNITYSFYPVYCKLYNIKYKTIPLNKNLEITLNKMNIPNGGIIFANPNTPTGHAISYIEIINFIESHNDSVVLIDEAYINFGSESAIPLIKKYKNLLIVNTLSKAYSLAGIRIGFAIGSNHLIKGLEKVKNSFNSYPIDIISELIAIEAIKDIKYLKNKCNYIIYIRENLSKKLKLIGFTVLPSKANFILVKPINISAKDLFIKLRNHGILVRYFNNLNDYIRISIGTIQQMNYLLETIKWLYLLN